MVLDDTQVVVRDAVRALAQDRTRPQWCRPTRPAIWSTRSSTSWGKRRPTPARCVSRTWSSARTRCSAPRATATGSRCQTWKPGRIGIAAQCLGIAQAAMEVAIGYAKDRRSMGKAIAERQAVGFRLADLTPRSEAARPLVLHAASLKNGDLPCLTEASTAKLVASETAEAVRSDAIQTSSGYGCLEEFGLAKIYRDVRVCQIYEGTSDIQRMVIARAR